MKVKVSAEREMEKKEVLVIFGDRRRPVTFQPSVSSNELLELIKLTFTDIIDISKSYYLQKE